MDSLQYWKDGGPILLVDDASLKELKYWLNGEGYVYSFKATTPSAETVNANPKNYNGYLCFMQQYIKIK